MNLDINAHSVVHAHFQLIENNYISTQEFAAKWRKSIMRTVDFRKYLDKRLKNKEFKSGYTKELDKLLSSVEEEPKK